MTPTGTDTPVEPFPAARATEYHDDGFLLLPPGTVTDEAVAAVRAEVPSILAAPGPQRVLERDDETVRSVYGVHRSAPSVAALARTPALLRAVRQILGGDVYVHQSKLNVKAPFSGDQWEWHQDFVYWVQNDGIERPDLVNVGVFLDEVTEFNGPLTFVPGSHRGGLLAGTDLTGMPVGYEDAPSWVATLTATEKFRIDPAVIEDLARRNGLVSPKGPVGSVLCFHPNILHSSGSNISPFGRTMLILVYNAVDNRPRAVTNPRPPFLADPDVAPLRPA